MSLAGVFEAFCPAADTGGLRNTECFLYISRPCHASKRTRDTARHYAALRDTALQIASRNPSTLQGNTYPLKKPEPDTARHCADHGMPTKADTARHCASLRAMVPGMHASLPLLRSLARDCPCPDFAAHVYESHSIQRAPCATVVFVSLVQGNRQGPSSTSCFSAF